MKSPSRTETNPLLSAAIRYAERGWPVFPLQPRDKIPFPRTTGFKEATTDRSTILRWWQVIPDANIGLATGVSFDVFDIDSADSMPHVRDILGQDYRHAGPVVVTGKGWHLYFQQTGLGNRAGLLGGKVDYRGLGGYVVAPPSIHPSGRVYRWDDSRPERTPLPVVPDNLRSILAKPDVSIPVAAIARTHPDGTVTYELTQHGEVAAGRPNILMVAESLGLSLFRKGGNWVTNCIFHPDPGPSMVLYVTQGKFFCYGCEAHGDSHDLGALRDMDGRVGVRP